MRVTNKMLAMASKQVNTGLFNYLSNKRWNEPYKGFENAIKSTIKDNVIFNEEELKKIASRTQGDEIGASLYIWLIQAIKMIAPDRVDAANFEIFKQEAIRFNLLIPSE